jgi:predicted lipoprotein with Yx(FWY)xxD motif
LATLYVYDKDVPGKSNCGAPCVSAWVPLLASAPENEAVGDWTLISRPDGRHQWAYKGRPVYLRYHDLSANSGNIRATGFQKLEP